jgi:hypothetical protein
VASTTRAGKPPDKPDPELLRRLRLYDMQAIFRARYGYALPDDDAGLSDLNDLLCVISTAANTPETKMDHAVWQWAPWLDPDKAAAMIDFICRMPMPQRDLTRYELGRRQNVTMQVYLNLGLKQIWPHDMTVAQMQQYRKARDTVSREQRRRRAGVLTRADYVTKSHSKTKPWLADGVCRRTWERRRVASVSDEQTGRGHNSQSIAEWEIWIDGLVAA